MPRSMRRGLPWLGVIAALLLLAPFALADEIEPEPYAEADADEAAPNGEADADEAAPAAESVDGEAGEAADASDEAAAEETDEAVEDAPNIARFFDVVLLRPAYLIRLAAGLPFFVFYPLTISSGWDDEVVAALWTDPYEATFVRPLGERFGEDY